MSVEIDEYVIEVSRTSEYRRWIQVTLDDIPCNHRPGPPEHPQWQSGLHQEWVDQVDGREDLWEPIEPAICSLHLDEHLADYEESLANYDREPTDADWP